MRRERSHGRRAFTIAETMIAGIVSLGVLATAYALFVSTRLQSDKAQALAGAAQSAAIFMHALEDDMANIAAGDSLGSSVSAITDPSTGEISLQFARRDTPIPRDTVLYKDLDGREVTYLARREPPHDLYKIVRIAEDEEPQEFGGVFAKTVRFTPVESDGGGAWLRVSLLIVGENRDPEPGRSVLQQKSILLSTVYRIPVKPEDDLD